MICLPVQPDLSSKEIDDAGAKELAAALMNNRFVTEVGILREGKHSEETVAFILGLSSCLYRCHSSLHLHERSSISTSTGLALRGLQSLRRLWRPIIP